MLKNSIEDDFISDLLDQYLESHQRARKLLDKKDMVIKQLIYIIQMLGVDCLYWKERSIK